MTKRKPESERTLKHDEKVLWNLVTRTVTPRKPRVASGQLRSDFEEHMREMEVAPKQPKRKTQPISKSGLRASKSASLASSAHAAAAPKPKVTHSPAPIAAHIDRPVYRKIAKGRLPIDSQIDLHDMTQDQAIYRLQNFLHLARNQGQRHVLVITGKGGSPTSEGVLRRMLPIWLNTPDFASIVNGYQVASRGHGGDGAFYVRLRRLR